MKNALIYNYEKDHSKITRDMIVASFDMNPKYIEKLKKRYGYSTELAAFISSNMSYDRESLLFIWYALVKDRTEKIGYFPFLEIRNIYKLYSFMYFPIFSIPSYIIDYVEDASNYDMDLYYNWYYSFGDINYPFTYPICRTRDWFIMSRLLIKLGRIKRPTIKDEMLPQIRNNGRFFVMLAHKEFLTPLQYNYVTHSSFNTFTTYSDLNISYFF